MFDIRSFVKKVLDDFFFDIGIEVWPEEKLNEMIEVPDEYVIFNCDGDVYIRYADNIPITKLYHVNVIWIGKDIVKKSQRVLEITKVMTQNGFRVKMEGKDLERDVNSKHYGFKSSFSFYKMVNGYEGNNI